MRFRSFFPGFVGVSWGFSGFFGGLGALGFLSAVSVSWEFRVLVLFRVSWRFRGFGDACDLLGFLGVWGFRLLGAWAL